MAEYRVKIEMATGNSFEIMLDGNTRIAPHFRLYELANTKGKISKPQFVINEEVCKFLNCMEQMRAWFVANMPKKATAGIKVNSLFRQVDYNRSVGGSANSLHLKCFALDWGLPGLTLAEYKAIEHEWAVITGNAGLIGGCNWYTRGLHLSIHEELLGNKAFVHRDYRGKKGDW